MTTVDFQHEVTFMMKINMAIFNLIPYIQISYYTTSNVKYQQRNQLNLQNKKYEQRVIFYYDFKTISIG